MDIKECYEILGITKKATDEQVKKAYREKSKQFHPDLHRDDKDATAKFAKVSEAYRLILENREKKHKSIFNFGTIFSDAGIKMNTEKKKETTTSCRPLTISCRRKSDRQTISCRKSPCRSLNRRGNPTYGYRVRQCRRTEKSCYLH